MKPIKCWVNPEKEFCNACLDEQVDKHKWCNCIDCEHNMVKGHLINIESNIFGKPFGYVCTNDGKIRRVTLDRVIVDVYIFKEVDEMRDDVYKWVKGPEDKMVEDDKTKLDPEVPEFAHVGMYPYVPVDLSLSDALKEQDTVEKPVEEPVEEPSTEPSTDEKCIAEIIGTPAVLENLAEESVELAHVALKFARLLRDENPTPASYNDILPKLNEEMGDVMVCMNELVNAGVISYEAVDSSAMAKEQRWYERVKGKSSEKID